MANTKLDFMPPEKKEYTDDETIVITKEIKEQYSIAQTPDIFASFEKKYKDFDEAALLGQLYLRTQTCKIFIQRYENAIKVIDLVAKELGIDDHGRYLYGPTTDKSSPIIDKIREYVSRSGVKAEMKKQIAELENENRVLRSLLGK